MRIVIAVAAVLFATQFAVASGHSCKAYSKLEKCHAHWDHKTQSCICR